MIIGAHSILYSSDGEADRAFLRDVLDFPHVDIGHGWLIFKLPPSEVAVHPAETGGKQEFYLMCENVDAFVAKMKANNVPVSPVHEEDWGLLVEITMPSGAKLGVYEPRHARP